MKKTSFFILLLLLSALFWGGTPAVHAAPVPPADTDSLLRELDRAIGTRTTWSGARHASTP